ncbi:hypothetical protein [Deinococcus sp.]|uniref:hypothetical protein n=1 Tax=Deinococcus sp. TaxID=47478 RepID=UPI0025C27A66|nr:hypothetical protein [Deinococcus sp.]
MNISVSGVTDFPALPVGIALISLRDPGDPLPDAVEAHDGPLLTLVFHDADGDDLDEPPQPWHLRQIERFLVGPGAGQELHVHCFAGISRSPAVASFALTVLHPELADDDVVRRVLAVRPQAQANPLILDLIDAHTGRELRAAWQAATERY